MSTIVTTDTRQPLHKSTKDLAFAAYAHMEGLAVVRAVEQRNGSLNEYSFMLADPDGRWETLFTRFANSESQRFDSSVRALKKLCKRNSG